jgi:hypothetical protein
MRVAVANFSPPLEEQADYQTYWASFQKPIPPPAPSLFDEEHDWGFHIFALAAYLLERGIASEAEFWDYRRDRRCGYRSGVLAVSFLNLEDLCHYLARFGHPDLLINYGQNGHPVLQLHEGKCFRVHVPCLRWGPYEHQNLDAECFLVDSEEFLDRRSMLYVPVVNTKKVRPLNYAVQRDFIYLASAYQGKRHDLLVNSVRGTELTGHLHPVARSEIDLEGTRITTSQWNERDPVELLNTSRIAVYPGDRTSNPAAMWECVAAGLPIVVNRNIAGGRHVVAEGATGELAEEGNFLSVMRQVLEHRDRYRPLEYFEQHWNTQAMLERYVKFFQQMGLEL